VSWYDAGPVDGIPPRGARVVVLGDERIAVFRAGDDRLFALRDRCPHRGGPLSQGIVHGHRVTCPLHDWVIELASGEAVAPDKGCTAVFEVRVEAGRVLVDVPEPAVFATGARAAVECA
jgi:nitrite reductase (NADH) small subunit